MSKLWDIFRLAEELDVLPGWVRNHTKEIPHLKLGKYIRFDPADLDFQYWLDSLRQKRYCAGREMDGPALEDQQMARTSYQVSIFLAPVKYYLCAYSVAYLWPGKPLQYSRLKRNAAYLQPERPERYHG